MKDQEIINVDKDRADAVLNEIDTIINKTEEYANHSVAKISKLLVEAKRGAYWASRGFENEDEYIKTLPYSRAQYYNLVGVGMYLGSLPEDSIAELGIKKSEALVRIVKHNPELMDEWLEKAKNESHKDFLKEVRSFFNKTDESAEEEFEWFRIKANKDQANIIAEALRIAGNIIGSEKSQAFQLEAICAEFLAGKNEDNNDRLQNRDGFMIGIIKELAKQLDSKALEALVGALAGVVEGE
jgi:hypothetical protein